ncbi:DUF3977 family protein [Bacillus haimaensis]|uniref:DUF3977 family protein n=1 Tax=Bacillus haimaensis TaxID=3160967 RepID=UPI003AA8309C
MKYIEFGVGNKWLLRTETELEDGSEYEEKGLIGPIKLQSVYIRVWIGRRVFVLDSSDGLKLARKDRNAVKVVIGMVSG